MQNRLMEIFDLLLTNYGPLHWWPADTPFEVCVGAILTQNTNWGNVEKAIENLKRAGVLTIPALWELDLERLAELIRPSGFFNVKSRRLKDFLGFVVGRYGTLEEMFRGDWRTLREELLAVRGVGRETCDSILLYAGEKPSFVVDAYTRRLFSRLGVVGENDDYETIRALFMDSLPESTELFNEYHALIVEHCKRHCRKRPVCAGCPLADRCCVSLIRTSTPSPPRPSS